MGKVNNFLNPFIIKIPIKSKIIERLIYLGMFAFGVWILYSAVSDTLLNRYSVDLSLIIVVLFFYIISGIDNYKREEKKTSKTVQK
jgi:hypothetical protein